MPEEFWRRALIVGFILIISTRISLYIPIPISPGVEGLGFGLVIGGGVGWIWEAIK